MNSQIGVALPPSPEKIESKFDLGIALSLSSWPALTLAVQNLWGGPESLEKRDWFAGAVSDLIAASPDADVEYVEEFLLQVMNDEFDVNVDDSSGAEVAAKIVGMRQSTLQGDFTLVDEMYNKWAERQNKGSSSQLNFKRIDREEDDDDTDGSIEDSEREDGEMEVEDETPTLVRSPQGKITATVDEDGFTEVVGRRRR